MNKNLPVNQGCISERLMHDYMNGSLHPKDQHAVEMHLLDCELCADALEGLRLIQSNEKTDKLVISLKKEINKKLRIAGKNRSINIQMMQIAAVIMILLLSAGSYYFINHFSKGSGNTVAYQPTVKSNTASGTQRENQGQIHERLNAHPNVETTASVAREKNIAHDGTISTMNKDALQKSKFHTEVRTSSNSPVADEKTTSEELNIEKAATADRDVNTMDAAKKETPLNDQIKINSKDNSEIQEIAGLKNNQNFSKTPAPNQNTGYDPSFSEGLRFYNENNFTRALYFFNRSFPDENVAFYSGVSHFKLKNYLSAVKHLDEAIGNPNASFYIEALWYKANALVALKETEKAKDTLKKILLQDSPYKTKAQDLLNHL